ncbi:hypothetical protein J3A83DRAFT_4205630 [Scleroderma citrinum]
MFYYANRSSILSAFTHLQMLDVGMYPSLIDHVVDCLVDAVEISKGNSPPLQRPSQLRQYSWLQDFVSRVMRLAHIPMGTILVALAYIDQMKLRQALDYGSTTYRWVFLGGLILANRFLGHKSLMAEEIAGANPPFNKTELNVIEAQFLLDFGFGAVTVAKDTILAIHGTFVEIALTEMVCHRTHFQPHEYPCTSRPSSKESYISTTSSPHWYWWWHKLWY